VHTLSEAQSDPPTAMPSRVAVDEKQIEVDGETKWLYAAIDIESRLLLEIDVFSRPQNASPSGVRTRHSSNSHNFYIEMKRSIHDSAKLRRSA
jgi:transposase-like protein